MTEIIKEDILTQLYHILATPAFKRSPMSSKLLNFVVKETLSKRSENLKGYVLAIDVFDRAPDFDLKNDPIVRVQANRLRTKLKEYYHNHGNEAPIVIELPKGSYVPIFKKVKLHKSRKILQSVLEPTISISIQSNTSPSKKFINFDHNLQAELQSSLSRFRGIKVSTSPEEMATSPHKKEVAIDLDYRLVGSITFDEENLRVIINLIDCHSNTIISSRSFDFKLTSLALTKVQEKISAVISAEIGEVHGTLMLNPPSLTRRSPDYNLIYGSLQRAGAYLVNKNPQSYTETMASIQQAVEYAPSHSSLWGFKAMLEIDAWLYNLEPRENSKPLLESALSAAQKAVQFDASNAIAWRALGITQFYSGSASLFTESMEKALTLNPNSPDLLSDFATHLWFQGKFSRAMHLNALALKLYPSSPNSYNLVPLLEAFRRNDREKLRSYLLKITHDGVFWVHIISACSNRELNENLYDASIEYIREFVSLSPLALNRTLDKFQLKGQIKNKIRNRLTKKGLNVDIDHNRNLLGRLFPTPARKNLEN